MGSDSNGSGISNVRTDSYWSAVLTDVRASIGHLRNRRRLLLVSAAMFAAMLGDVFTTWYGIEHVGLRETNAAVATYLDAYGYSVLFVGKAFTAGIALGAVGVCARLCEDSTRWIVYSPAIELIGLNALVTAHNGMLILSA